MKKTILTILAGVALMTSCSQNQNKEYVIYGTVSDTKLEGAKIYLVPFDNHDRENIDSTYIKNHSFEFHGTQERMVELRVEKRRRFGVQSLLVVTEPGNTYVTIGGVSIGRGTPQNDSLQAWKSFTMLFNEEISQLSKEGLTEEMKALQESHMARTRQMASNVGKHTTLGAFLDARVSRAEK